MGCEVQKPLAKRALIPLKFLRESMGILVGSAITALGMNLFLVPNKIAAGGVSGIAIIIHYLAHLPVGATMLIMEIPLFIASMRFLGFGFGIRTLLGAVSLPFFIDGFAPYLQKVTENNLLASLYGGIFVGVGIGIVFRSKGSTGGTDELAALIHRFIKIPLGQILLVLDGLIIAGAGIVFGLESALYALITVFVTSRVIDVVQEGLSVVRAALIISDYSEDIAKGILGRLNRGATALEGTGLYTGKRREILLAVVSQSEVSLLKEVVYEVDADAFLIVADVHEVLGEGFKKWA
ncbi:MAG: YitT family protein [Carboxydocellales bacterium]